jgi:hypothetical protein
MPIPTLHGIGHVCIDVGQEAETVVKEPEQNSALEIPSCVNAQRIPCGSDGNIFTRAGLRPHTLVRDTMARIKAAAQQRLDVKRSMESWTEADYNAAFSRDPLTIDDPFWDPYEDFYGVANIPRSQLLANTIDPLDVTAKAVFVAIVFRRYIPKFNADCIYSAHVFRNGGVSFVLFSTGRNLYQLFRATFLRHERAGAIVVYLAQVLFLSFQPRCCSTTVA